MKFVVILFLVALTGINCNDPNGNMLVERFFWDTPEFDIPPNRLKQALASGSYIPLRNGIHSLAAWRDKMFVGSFRFQRGVASSLNYFSLKTADKSPVFIPYPSFEDNYINEDPNNRTVSLPSNSSAINALHLEIDKCSRLWVADSGFTEHFGDKRWIASPAIIIYDLITNTLIRRIELQQFSHPFTILGQVALDFEGDDCENVHAYVSDFFRSIIVYSFKKDLAWQVEHNFMGSDPLKAHFEFGDLDFDWNHGIYALGVGERQPDGSKHVYFSPLASTKVFYVSNRVLQDENYPLNKHYYDFHLLGDGGQHGHLTTIIYHEKTGALFNTMFDRPAVNCWNIDLPYHTMTTVHKADTNMEFYPLDINIDDDDNLWVVSSLVPKTAYEEMETGKRNIRMFRQSVEEVVAGTECM